MEQLSKVCPLRNGYAKIYPGCLCIVLGRIELDLSTSLEAPSQHEPAALGAHKLFSNDLTKLQYVLIVLVWLTTPQQRVACISTSSQPV